MPELKDPSPPILETPGGQENVRVELDSQRRLRAELALLATEMVNESLADIDTMQTTQLVATMNAEDTSVPAAVAKVGDSIAAAIDATVERLALGGRLVYIGAGTAGRIGILDATECPPTFGTDPSMVIGIIAGGAAAIRSSVEDAEDDAEAGKADLASIGLSPADVVVGISASGRTPYVIAALNYASEIGALGIGLACNEGSPVGAASQIPIEVVVGPELLAGSTRLKAGTAQKLVLNMISTITMVRLGKTFGNIMVDLRSTNNKLRARAELAVMRAASVTPRQASEALDAVGGSVKEAILVLKTGLSPDAGRMLLAANGGFLRAAIESHFGE